MPNRSEKEHRQSLERRHAWSDIFDRLPFGNWAPGMRVERRGWMSRGDGGPGLGWTPEVESFQRGDEFVVRADLPGLEKQDVTVELEDDAIVIEGERTDERRNEREGYYSTERRYGQFCRVVPLPDGAITDSAKATFTNGVLEVVMKAPPHEAHRGRRLEIGDRP
jgi:HSP20 family protein